MHRRPHLVMLAWGFPPCRSGGVYRALATANAFADGDWRVTVVTADREAFERYTGADPSLEARVRPEIDVVRVPFRWPAQDTDVRAYPWLRAVLPPVWRRLRSWRDVVHFPEVGYGPWLGDLTAAVGRVHSDRPADLLLATANPYVTFAAAADVAARHGVPYVLDYRDAWSLDVFSGRTLHGRRTRVGRTEARVLAGAHEVWFVNGPIRDWHASRFPESAGRMHVVANGWDPDLLDLTGLDERGVEMARTDAPATDPVSGERPLHVGYLGTVTPKVPLGPLLEGWRLAVERGDLPAGSTLTLGGYLGYFAVPDPLLVAMVERSAPWGVRYAGPVAKAQVGAFYGGLDALVLALGPGRYVTSGKVFEYAATGLPVLAVHPPDSAASDVLADHPLRVTVRSVDPEGVAEGFAALRRVAPAPAAARADARSAAERFRRDAQLAPRIRALTPEVAR